MAEDDGSDQVSMPTEDDLKQMSEDERLKEATEADISASSIAGMVNDLRSKASMVTNPSERDRLLTEAFNGEVQVRGLSKKARVLKSGTFQGAIGGAGIGAATGVGLGTITGTVVGTVATIPTTLLGGLVGSGVGMFHGPWLKLGGGGDKKEGDDDSITQIPQEAIDKGLAQINEKSGQVTAQNPDALKSFIAKQEGHAPAEQKEQGSENKPERRKPKKLEIRSNKQASRAAAPPTSNDTKPKKKPAKLEVRAGKEKKVA